MLTTDQLKGLIYTWEATCAGEVVLVEMAAKDWHTMRWMPPGLAGNWVHGLNATFDHDDVEIRVLVALREGGWGVFKTRFTKTAIREASKNPNFYENLKNFLNAELTLQSRLWKAGFQAI